MNRTIITGITILVLLIIGITIFKEGLTGQTTLEPIVLGYCPTMKPIAENIAQTNHQVVLLAQPSSAQALQELNNQNIDVALIGRLAEQKELQSANEMILEDGYTLVTNAKKFIQENELTNIKIHTAIAEEVAREILPNTEINFYSTTQEAVNKGLPEAVLIDWDEYKDEYELLVVMNGMEKVEQFRIPVLYSNKYDLEKIIVEI